MRPIKLELSGLNSYIDRQEVDFEKLTERGLFGIFGNTGSGKSTILDAITIAMYGNISRNTKEYINSSCDKAVISYEFEMGSKNNRRRYLVDRTIVRSKTGTKTSHARLVEINGQGEKNVLADKVGEVNEKVAQVVGLTANDFTRSVVLPQGKFNEFLKLTGSDRRDMLERIFGLEKYGRGLIERVRKRKNIEMEYLKDIKSKLSQYDEVTEESYENTEKELIILKDLEKSKTKELDLTEKEYAKSKEIYANQELLEQKELRKKELDKKDREIKEKSSELENAVKADNINPYITRLQNLDNQIEKDSLNIENLEKKLNILNQELIIIKNKHEEAIKSQSENLPKLSEERIKLQTAIKLENEIITADKELRDMKAEGLNLAKLKENEEKSKKEIEYKRDELIKSVKELEQSINNIKISAGLKQKIFLAYEQEREYNRILLDKNQKLEKLKQLNKNLEELNIKHRYSERDKIAANSELDKCISHMKILEKRCPGENKDIVSKTEYVTELKSKIENIKEYETKKDDIQKELSLLLEKKYELEREINSTTQKIESIKKDINKYKSEIEELKYLNLAIELRRGLKENSPCPVCGSREHETDTTDKLGKYDENIAFIESKLEKLEKEESKLRKELDESGTKSGEYISIEKIKNKELEELKEKIGDKSSSYLTKELEDEQKKLEILKVSVETWLEDKADTEKRITKFKEEKNNTEKEEIKLLESIKSNKKLIHELKQDLEELESKYIKVKQEYLNLKSITKVSDLESKVEEIRENEKVIDNLNDNYSKVCKDRDIAEEQIKKYQEELYKVEMSLNSTRELYLEKKKYRDNKYNELVVITKGESADRLLENVEEEIKKIIELEQVTKNKLEEQRKEYESNLSNKNSIEGTLKRLREEYKDQSKTLNQLLSENKFESIYAVKKSLLDEYEIKTLREEISEYEEEQKLLDFKISELKEKLGDKRIKKEEFEELKNNIYKLKTEIGNISKEIGSKQNELFTLKSSLDKIKILNKELKKRQHKFDLLEELDKSIQGNKFVEYVATNQLRYIALDASKRLDTITKGRYALEIDSTLNFVMRDNFSGGQRRSVDTLSGGEIFLTSLSLSLALSSQIQLKGNAPLEFFFLDEGFGSLDSDLLEIVIQSLERLQSDKLSVGIISHVDELKSRVPIKLLVTPSEAGVGSRVDIEYS